MRPPARLPPRRPRWERTNARTRRPVATNSPVPPQAPRRWEACLLFHQVIHAWFVEQRPFHTRYQPSEQIAGSRSRLDHLFEQGHHRVLIEAITAQVSDLPAPQLELARTQCLLRVDAGFGQP